MGFGRLNIRRLIPGDGTIHMEWEHKREYVREGGEFLIQIWELASGGPGGGSWIYRVPQDVRSFDAGNLCNGIDYVISLSGYQRNVKVAQASARLFRPCPAPGVTVAYCHPEDYTFNSSGRSTCSPSLLRLPNGRLLASHDFYWSRGGQNLSHVYCSDDDGATWHFLSEIHPCFWPKTFWHQGKVHMLGCATEYGSLELFRSDDLGRTWSAPAALLEGHEEKRPDLPGPHRNPTPLTVHNGRLWGAVEFGTWEIPTKLDAGVISVPLEADPMIPANWTVTPFARYNPDYPGAVKGGDPAHLEGNIVVTPDGGLVNFMRYQTNGADPDYGKALLYRVDKDNPGAPLEFDRIIDFPGNLSKFNIIRDDEGRYITLVNRVNIPWRSQRNILSLSVSEDLYHWRIVKDLLNYQENGWPEGYKQVGFQYADLFLEKGDIYCLSRTAIGGAHNFHDANRITFHKLENYRRFLHGDSSAS